MALGNPFIPGILAQTTCSVTASSTFFPIPATTGGTGPFASGGECIEVSNVGPATIFIESCGGPNGTVAATVANSYAILSGQCKIIGMHNGDTGISAIGSAAGPTTLFVTRGNGV